MTLAIRAAPAAPAHFTSLTQHREIILKIPSHSLKVLSESLSLITCQESVWCFLSSGPVLHTTYIHIWYFWRLWSMHKETCQELISLLGENAIFVVFIYKLQRCAKKIRRISLKWQRKYWKLASNSLRQAVKVLRKVIKCTTSMLWVIWGILLFIYLFINVKIITELVSAVYF